MNTISQPATKLLSSSSCSVGQRPTLARLLALARFTFMLALVPLGGLHGAQLTLTWVDNSNNEAGFKIERRLSTEGTFTEIATVARNVTTYVDTAVVNGTEYFYQVRATNVTGNSSYTNPANGIPKLDQTITFGSLTARTFGDSSFNLTATATSGQTVSYSSSDTSVATISGNTVTIVGAGNTTISANQPGNTEFNPAPPVPQTLTVGKAPLIVTADNKTRTYGASNPALTATITGFVNSQTLATSDVTGLPQLATTATTGTNVGTVSITVAVGTLASANYSFATFNNGLLTITPAPLTVTADDKTRNYGAANPTLTATLTGFVNSQTLATSGVTGSASLGTTATPSTGVSAVPITVAVGSLSATNYSFTTLNNGTLTIAKAPLAVVADNKTRTYGTANPTFTATISGFVNSETLATSGVSGSPDLSTTANAATGAGSVPITVALGTLTAANYSFTPLTNGTLTITAATVTPAITANSKPYDGTTAATIASRSLSGVVGTDDVTLSGGTATFASTGVGTGLTVTATGLTLSGTTAANYQLASTTATTTANITAATVTPTVTASNKTFDGTTAASISGRSLSGVIGTDDVTLTGGTAVFASANAGNGIAVNIAGLSLSGTTAPNYQLSATTAATTANITPASQTITFGTLGGKTFGDAPFDVNATASSGLPVTFSISGPATISGNTVTLTGIGTVVVRASQTGDANYTAAADVDRSFDVGGGAPVFTLQPVSQTVAPGSNMTFTVAVTGTPTPTLQWQRSVDGGVNFNNLANDANYSGVTSATMTIIATPLVYNNYRYRAVATNIAGSVNSSVAVLTVDANAPAFTTQPANQSVTPGANASFTVVVTGTPAPTLVWQLSTDGGTTWSNVPSSSPYSGVTSNTLTITSATLSLSTNRYRAVATNTIGSAFSNAASLTVSGVAPTFSSHPVDQSISVSGNATFAAVATGTPTPTFQWQISTDGGTIWTNLAAVAPYSGVTTNTLLVTSAASTLNGTRYRVVATNTAGSTNSNGALLTVTTPPPPPPPPVVIPPPSVPPPPVISAHPTSQSVIAPAAASFSVTATGTSLAYQWRKDGNNISGANGPTLSFDPSSLAHAGVYTVVVSNGGGAVTSNSATLSVESAPVIAQQPVAQTVVLGSNASFSVTANAAPPPNFQWRKNGANLAGQTGATLNLSGVALDAAGMYSVVVSNVHGSVTSADAELKVNQVTVAGSYFGSFPDGGTWALHVRADNTATYIGYLPGSGIAVVTELTIAADGSFSISGTSLALRPAATSGGDEPARAAAATPFTLTGRIVGGRVSGQLLGQPLTGTIDQGSNAAAGFYRSSALLTASGTTYSIVGPSGKTVAVTMTPTFVDAVSGTVGSDNQLGATTVNGGQVALTLTGSDSMAVTYTPPSSTTSVKFAGLSDTTRSNAALSNLSIRSKAGAGLETLIVGFTVSGGTKPILIRGVGPSLAAFNVPGTLPDPKLDLMQSGVAQPVQTNDNWDPSASDTFARVGAFALTGGSRDAAVLASLSANSYTAHLTDVSGATGIALVELYDTQADNGAKLINVSARAQVGTDGAILIAGFNISGRGPRTVLIRAIGPTLAQFGVTGSLADPKLELFAAGEAVAIAANDNWNDSAAGSFAPVGAFALVSGTRDAVLLVTLNPGSYTAQVAGVGNTSGVALVEVYELP